jgi:hypothetical protein
MLLGTDMTVSPVLIVVSLIAVPGLYCTLGRTL